MTSLTLFAFAFSRNALIPFAIDSTVQSYVGMTNVGANGGIAYIPGVCGPMKYRTAVVRSFSDKDSGQVLFLQSPVVIF